MRYRAQIQPDRLAYRFLQDGDDETARLSYGQLDQQAQAIAAQLQSLNLAGERALLLYPSGLDFVAAFFGCLYASVVAIPAYPPRPNQKMMRLEAIVADAEAKLVLTTSALAPGIESRFAQSPGLDALPCLATDRVAESRSHWQAPDVSDDTLAFLQYTSGSTGSPKGVMVSHGNLLHNCRCMHQAFALTPDSVMVSWLPSFHDMGLIFGILEPIYAGAIDILMPPTAFVQHPIRWLQTLSRYRGTHSGGPNFAYELCLSKIKPDQMAGLDLSPWRYAYNGAEPVRRQTLEGFANLFKPWGFSPSALYPCYGMAEATLMISGGTGAAEPIYHGVDAGALAQDRVVDADTSPRYLVGCGQGWLDTKIAVVDPTELTLCDPDQVGEIWVSGRSVAQGYWQRPTATAETFAARLPSGEGPFLRTGDLGYLHNGELFVTGRLKDVVIVRGRNHYPQDIELTVQQSHPALKIDCGAAFTVDDNGEDRLVVVQEVHRQALRQLDVEAIAAAIRRAVAEEHELEVAAIALVKPASIPKTSSGKIQRRACKTGFLTETLRVVGLWQATPAQRDRPAPTVPQAVAILEPTHPTHAPAQTATQAATAAVIQAWLVAQLSARLSLDPSAIDPHQSLAQYGLDSLAMVTLAGELEDWLGHPLPNTVVYDHPSIAALAQHLAQTSGSEIPSCLVPLQPQGAKPPFFCVHPLAGVAFPYYPLMRSMGVERPFYALQAVGIEAAEQPLTTIEAMATRYIAALRRVQPQGPYHVGGWSFGAYVALEIATQLQQQGQSVAKVILLDTPPLAANKLSNLIDLLTFFLTSSAPHIWPYIYDYIQLQLLANQLPKDGNFWDLIHLLDPETIVNLWERESRLMTLRQPAVQRVIGVIKANSEALIQYQPKPYAGQITLLNGEPLFGMNTQNAIAGWLNLAQGGAEVYQIPGHHFSILRHPHVEILAERLSACLDSA